MRNKGNVVIYVVLVGFLLILISLIMLKFQLQRSSELQRKILIFNSSTTEAVKVKNKSKEEILNNLYNSINTNKEIDTNEKLNKYKENTLSKDITDYNQNGIELSYDSKFDAVVMKFTSDTGNSYREYYSLCFKDSKLKIIFLGQKEG
ncbi:hypothetical protein CLORY_12990 [Clostridium oryzae]|uniref:Uncharacterized protein n=2 Tax=Clostridium oryzae TaxID=1450648 RepID=A0A1V4ITG3_9CLOT|nr:hypothetical protein CLORY_12990 [Clostridium oryzae]